MKTIKRIAAFVLAISLCFVLMLNPAVHAAGTPLLGGQQFGAWMLAGLLSINTVVSALQSTTMEPLRQWQANPWSESNPYFQYPFEPVSLSDYMNASVIKVDQGKTTIDGVVYDELWLSPEGAQKLKANTFDFKTKWAILSNDAGTLATGIGTIAGVPIYNVNGTRKSQTFYLNIGIQEIGNISVRVYQAPKGIAVQNTYPNGSTSTSQGTIKEPYSCYIAPSQMSGETMIKANMWCQTTNTGNPYLSIPDMYIDNENFQFDYVSGIVPAEEADIPDDYGMSLLIPHDKLQTFYNTYPEYNIDNSVINIQEDEIDINELTNAIFDMIDSMEEMKAEWTKEEEPPEPVDPIDNIDQNVSDITQYQQDMQQQVDHMHQDVEAIHQTQQQQQQVQQQMQQDTSSIDSTLKDATATPGQSDLPSFKFDLRELFPFCIPFDIYRLLSSFDATPTAPHVRLPIVIQSIGFNYTLDLDFSSWDPVAQAMRSAELIVYAIGLAWATGKVIKW